MMKRLLKLLTVMIILILNNAASAQIYPGAISPDSLVGNVYGSVKDSSTGKPIKDAEIFLFTQSLEKSSAVNTILTNKGRYKLPDINLAVKHAVSNYSGEFLINSVKTPSPYKPYTILVKASGYNDFIINLVPVLPGAVMSLQINCSLSKYSGQALYYDGNEKNGPFIYRDELIAKEYGSKVPVKSKYKKTEDLQYSIYATREGLVGYSCANGHIIVSHDHFVALPSFLVLNKNDKTYDFQVKVTYGNKSVIAPVWDVGPWNVKDDYWNPDSLRQIYATLHHGGKPGLGEGVPESQAAYYSNYNQDWSGDFNGSGSDYYKVKLPAGIDLADGTFWDDLNLPDNGWVQVNYLWRPGVSLGDTVKALSLAPVEVTPGGASAGQEQAGSTGVIVDGPKAGYYSGTYYIWWKIYWSDGLSGWTFEKVLQRIKSNYVNIAFNTEPAGLAVTIDGNSYTTPYTYSTAADSAHTISAAAQATGNTRYNWSTWSDMGQNPHKIFPYTDKTYTAYFSIQYQLKLISNPPSGGYFSSLAVIWLNPGETFSIAAVANDGYNFTGWTGDTTSSNSTITVKVWKPMQLTANFSPATAVSGSGNGLPKNYYLYQNYPNPFNPSTIIYYQIPSSSMVTLTVYDILGRKVEALVNEMEPAGKYSVNFDASKFTSGVYFYRLRAGNYLENKKMILSK